MVSGQSHMDLPSEQTNRKTHTTENIKASFYDPEDFLTLPPDALDLIPCNNFRLMSPKRPIFLFHVFRQNVRLMHAPRGVGYTVMHSISLPMRTICGFLT